LGWRDAASQQLHTFEEVRVELTADEVGVIQDPSVQIAVGLDSFHHDFVQGTPHARQRDMAILPMRN
jgi:hypothetical protein